MKDDDYPWGRSQEQSRISWPASSAHGRDLNTTDGIADFGFAFMAWFVDLAKNCMGLTQFK